MDYLKLYDLERYLFEVVYHNFQTEGKLSAFDFFCIIIWKANRAKSKVAQRLLSKDKSKDLNAIVEDLTSAIARAADNREKMRILISDWGFRLPMASAILTVLYPDDFTVYDVRVYGELDIQDFAQNKSRFNDLWNGYNTYVENVKKRAPEVSVLRDKDRLLWAKSFEKQLKKDIMQWKSLLKR